MDMKTQISRIGWAYAIFYLVSVGMQYLVIQTVLFLSPMLPFWILSDNGLVLISQVCMYGIGFPFFYGLIRKLPRWKMQEDRRIAAGNMILILILCLGTAYIGNVIGQALMMITDAMFGTQSLNPVTDTLQDMSLGGVFLSTVVVAPVMEELMFRKLLIDRIVPFGQRMAVVISGVGFGLFHGNFYQFFYACSLGMIFAYLYSCTGKIRYSIGLHMFINLMGGFLPLVLEIQMGWGNPVAGILVALFGFLIFLSIVGTVVIGCLLWHKLTWFPAWIGGHGMERVKSILTASGFWAFWIMSAVDFILMQMG